MKKSTRFSEMKCFFKGKKVLVTGHTGFKGSWLTSMLLSLEAEVIGYALPPSTTPDIFSLLQLNKRIKNYQEDIRDLKTLVRVVVSEPIDIVFHLAAQPLVIESYRNPVDTFATNLMGSVNLLEAIRQQPSVKAVVMITTDKVYENREWAWPYRETDRLGGYDPYSASKATAEIAAASYTQAFFNLSRFGIDHSTLIATARAGNVIGGGDWSADRIVPDLIRAVFEKKKPVIIRNPSAIRPWQHVLEPLWGYLVLARELMSGNQKASGSWNFAPPSTNAVEVEYIARAASHAFKAECYESAHSDIKVHEAHFLRLDSSKAYQILGWRSLFQLEKVLDETFSWYEIFYSGRDIVEYTGRQIQQYMEAFDSNETANSVNPAV